MTHRDLEPLDRVEPGDEFTWKNIPEGEEREWYPCESFIGQRVERLQRHSNVIFRRPLCDERTE